MVLAPPVPRLMGVVTGVKHGPMPPGVAGYFEGDETSFLSLSFAPSLVNSSVPGCDAFDDGEDVEEDVCGQGREDADDGCPR